MPVFLCELFLLQRSLLSIGTNKESAFSKHFCSYQRWEWEFEKKILKWEEGKKIHNLRTKFVCKPKCFIKLAWRRGMNHERRGTNNILIDILIQQFLVDTWISSFQLWSGIMLNDQLKTGNQTDSKLTLFRLVCSVRVCQTRTLSRDSGSRSSKCTRCFKNSDSW